MKKYIWRFAAFCAALCVVIIMYTGCDKDGETAFQVATLKGPTGMGMVRLMDKVDNGESDLKAEFLILGVPDDIVGKVVSGEVEMACLPTNLAAVLYNKTGGKIQMAAVNTLGVLYIVETGNKIQSFEDLRGKKVWATGKGATPEYVLKYVLESHGLKPGEDVELEFSLRHVELAAVVASGDVPLAMLPQPHVTNALMKNDEARIALDINDAWKAATELELTVGCIIVNSEFAGKNRKVVSKFLEEYKESVQWVNNNQNEASNLIESYGILPKAQIAIKALPHCNIVYQNVNESRNSLNKYFEILFEYNPKSIGGKMPGEDFYFEE